MCSHFSKGKKHDFALFKQSLSDLPAQSIFCVDSGYQGIEKIYANTFLPYKNFKHAPLSDKQKKMNLLISKSRILVEHVIRSLKIFRIIAERYRNRRKRFELRLNLIAALYNLELN